MSARVLIERLKNHGVTFDREPTRAHRAYHGDLSDVFLVDDRFFSGINARYEGRQYVEVGVGTEVSCRKLAKLRVYVGVDDDFSGYGDGLWLSATPRKDAWGKDKYLFVMEASPTRAALASKPEGERQMADTTKPNPGSPEAVAQGCTCPVIDNHYGKGVPVGKDGSPLFWHSERCPMHGAAALTGEPK